MGGACARECMRTIVLEWCVCRAVLLWIFGFRSGFCDSHSSDDCAAVNTKWCVLGARWIFGMV